MTKTVIMKPYILLHFINISTELLKTHSEQEIKSLSYKSMEKFKKKILHNKNVNIKFSGHDTFLE
jgi:hypothetical protein